MQGMSAKILSIEARQHQLKGHRERKVPTETQDYVMWSLEIVGTCSLNLERYIFQTVMLTKILIHNAGY